MSQIQGPMNNPGIAASMRPETIPLAHKLVVRKDMTIAAINEQIRISRKTLRLLYRNISIMDSIALFSVSALCSCVFQIRGRARSWQNNNAATAFLDLADVAISDVAFPLHTFWKVASNIAPVSSANPYLLRSCGVFNDEAGRGVDGEAWRYENGNEADITQEVHGMRSVLFLRYLAHRAMAAFRALFFRSSSVCRITRALPPLRPRATAWMFLAIQAKDYHSEALRTIILTMRTASHNVGLANTINPASGSRPKAGPVNQSPLGGNMDVQYTAQQISQAIARLNQKRKPLLRIMNAPGFTMNTAGKWAISAELCGLNTATRRLEEARARYVIA